MASIRRVDIQERAWKCYRQMHCSGNTNDDIGHLLKRIMCLPCVLEVSVKSPLLQPVSIFVVTVMTWMRKTSPRLISEAQF